MTAASARIDTQPPARAASRGARRVELIEQAARLFGARGYDDTSMRDIAAAFGILPGSLYHHFASKEQLFVAVYAAGVDRMIEAALQAGSGIDSPVRRMEAVCIAHLQQLLGTGNPMAPVLLAWPPRPAALRDHLVRERDRYEQVIDALLAGVRLHPDVERRFFRLSLLGALNWALAWYQPDRGSPAAIARKIFATFRPMVHDD